jgi:hypothetical protein
MVAVVQERMPMAPLPRLISPHPLPFQSLLLLLPPPSHSGPPLQRCKALLVVVEVRLLMESLRCPGVGRRGLVRQHFSWVQQILLLPTLVQAQAPLCPPTLF